jgi:type II secretory pathway component PulF
MREQLYRHIASQIANGISIETGLFAFKKRVLRRKMKSTVQMIDDISRRMRDGSTFADALKRWIPGDEYGVISAGELSGALPKSLELIIESKRRVARVYSAIKAALINPAIYLVVTMGMLWAIGKFVTPVLEQSLPKAKVHGLALALYVVGDFVTSWWAVLPLLGLVGLGLWIIYSLNTWTGKYRIEAEKYFPYSFYRDMNGYIWLMSFTQLLRAGMPDTVILARQKTQGSLWMRERIKAIWYRMDNGASLAAALLEKGKHGLPAFGFPNPDLVDDIESMSGFPDFPEKIAQLAMQWADDLEKSALAYAKGFGFAMEIVMYTIMGVLMIAINSMSTQIGNISHM